MLTGSEIDQRAAVIKEVMSWCGTPYKHQADIKNIGCDCGMLLVRVFVDSGLLPPFDPRPYANDWCLHKNDEMYLRFVVERASKVETPFFGDLVLFRHGRTYSHAGVVISWPYIVHASQPSGCVLMEDVEKSPFYQKPRMFFSFWKK